MQHKQWEKEYGSGPSTTPTTDRQEPSSCFKVFEGYLRENGLRIKGPILDLGCGNGRNAFYFAKKGHKVFATEFVYSVLNKAKKQAEAKKISNIDFIKHTLPEKLPFVDDSLGLVLDIATTTSLNANELKRTRDEVYRVLKPGGLFLTFTPADHNPLYKNFKSKNKNKFVLLPNKVWNRIWNIPDLASFYSRFKPQIIYLKHKNDIMGGKKTQLDTIMGVFEK